MREREGERGVMLQDVIPCIASHVLESLIVVVSSYVLFNGPNYELLSIMSCH